MIFLRRKGLIRSVGWRRVRTSLDQHWLSMAADGRRLALILLCLVVRLRALAAQRERLALLVVVVRVLVRRESLLVLGMALAVLVRLGMWLVLELVIWRRPAESMVMRLPLQFVLPTSEGVK